LSHHAVPSPPNTLTFPAADADTAVSGWPSPTSAICQALPFHAKTSPVDVVAHARFAAGVDRLVMSAVVPLDVTDQLVPL